jgi:hypothetical protein
MSTERRRAKLPFLACAAGVVGLTANLLGCPGTLDDPSRFEGALAADSMAPCHDVVSTVFTARCALGGCHTTMTMAGSLDLEAPHLYQRLDGVPASSGPGVLIDPSGDPGHSVLYEKLTSSPPFGAQMPLAGPLLDPSTLACVAAWIRAGGHAADGGTDAPSKPDSGSKGDATGVNDATDTGTPGVALFVATGYQNRRIVSLDGKSWIHDTVDPPSSLDDIGTGLAIGNGTIVVAGHTGIYTSTDGMSWTKLPPPVPQAWPGLGGAAATFGGGQFVIVASNDSWTSPDGVTFTDNMPDGASVAATHWDGIAYGNGHYFAVGDSNGPGDRKVSEDGARWHDYVQDSTAWSGVAFGAGVFVAVGANGRRAWTADGVTLNDTTDTSLGSINGVTFGNGKFVIAGQSATAMSSDGKTWTTSGSYPASELSTGAGLFMTVTWVSNILTSPDGQNWTTVFSGDAGTPALSRIAWGTVGGT